VEELKACKVSPSTQRWEILVKWYGLDDVEASWEPAETIKEDVPVLFQAFLNAHPDDADRRALAAATGSTIAPGQPQPRATKTPRSKDKHGKKAAAAATKKKTT
jgi:hypothetical protein